MVQLNGLGVSGGGWNRSTDLGLMRGEQDKSTPDKSCTYKGFRDIISSGVAWFPAIFIRHGHVFGHVMVVACQSNDERGQREERHQVQPENDPRAIASLGERMKSSLAQTLRAEMEHAIKAGTDADVFLRAEVSTLLQMTAFAACNLISGEADPNEEGVQSQLHRIQVGLSQAFDAIMQDELKKTGRAAKGGFS